MIEDHGQNKLSVTIKGKQVFLRCTVSQHQRFLDHYKEHAEDITNTKDFGELLSGKHFRNSEVVFIALNPDENKIEFDKEFISSNFDIDEIAIIANKWIERKIMAPSVVKDPTLSPSTGKDGR